MNNENNEKALASELLALLLRPEQIEVDDHSHRQIARAIGMQLIARISDRAVRNELRLQATRLIDRDTVEIGDAVEEAGAPDEVIQASALRILLRRAMVRAAQRSDDRGTDQAQVGPTCPDEADDLLHTVSHFFQRRVAVPAEVVDTFEPDHVG